MAEIRDQTLSGDQLIDGNVYIGCTFKDARLVYEGGVPPSFDACGFNNSFFAFQGPAGQTLSFLKAMAPRATNMRQVVLGLIPELND